MQLELPFQCVEPDFVRHPRARHYIVRVRDDGTVRVTIPRGGSRREARKFADRQHGWIENERRRVEAERRVQGVTASPEAERELRERAARELPPRVWELARAHGLTVSRVSVRNQRWRWGACSKSGQI